MKTKYVEPSDFFPKEVRKKAGIGEFAPKERTTKKSAKTDKKKK